MDLGAGGGLPGLVLALGWPASHWVYLDASERRTAFLTEAVDEVGLADRVQVLRGRAEDLGRDPALRGGFDLVTARGFGAPAVTAECAAPFLAVGGRLLVSEPPGDDERWIPAGLALLGLLRGPRLHGCQVLDQTEPCPDRYPRRVGIPAKRPLFTSPS
jgi:16S rRNA (guanine527-N7)-methyltransferase